MRSLDFGLKRPLPRGLGESSSHGEEARAPRLLQLPGENERLAWGLKSSVFKSQVHLRLAVCLWISHCSSLDFCFLTYKMGMLVSLTYSQGYL